MCSPLSLVFRPGVVDPVTLVRFPLAVNRRTVACLYKRVHLLLSALDPMLSVK